jgi:enoyl-CoA hydratase/carnithine racemase
VAKASSPTVDPGLLIDVRDGVAILTINGPDTHNAIAPAIQDELREWLRLARTDDRVGAVIVTGAGNKAFVAGADLNALHKYTPANALDSRLQGLLDEIERFDKPTIAAINGFALGGGCEMAMACDIRIGSTTASFGLPEVGLAILPGAGGTQRLARLVGVGRAIDLILTGRRVAADEALQMGLITRLVKPDDLIASATDLARQILAKGPLAVRLAKLAIRSGFDTDQDTGLVIERLALAVLYGSDDKQEGITAFFDKREPRFNGR